MNRACRCWMVLVAAWLAEDSVMKTPNIDRLGREGVYFRNAFCTTSLGSPSRASILGGLYAHAHSVVNNSARSENPVTHPAPCHRSTRGLR